MGCFDNFCLICGNTHHNIKFNELKYMIDNDLFNDNYITPFSLKNGMRKKY